MRVGVYVNKHLDRGDLLYYNGKKLELADHLTYDDLDIELEIKKDVLVMNFSNLEYLGDL